MTATSSEPKLQRNGTPAASFDQYLQIGPRSYHLYVPYADQAQNLDPNDKADVFFVRSTDGGTNWTSGERVSTVSTNDQWMPMIAIKPDGTKLLVAWYDRRNDAKNYLIDLYGRWGTIAVDGTVTFGTEFRVSTRNFPAVFAGTLVDNKTEGFYDPAYPPGEVNLNWVYPEWPLTGPFGEPVVTASTLEGHVGEYNGAFADDSHVYLTWTDSRLTAHGTLLGISQRDIRLARLAWPL
jgi:hypothetical protein